MIFNPEESIDIHGFTGPFVQYTHARIKSILRKADTLNSKIETGSSLLKLEKDLTVHLERFPAVIAEAAADHDPSKIAIYVFNLAQTFNSFYSQHSIANAEDEQKKHVRLLLCQITAQVIKNAMGLLGIPVPERM